MPEDPHGRFICEACGRRFAGAGDCPACPDEPLLDLADEDVVLMIESFDAAAQRRRYFLCFLGAAVVAVPVGLVLVVLGASTGVRSLAKLAFLAGAGILIGLTTLLAFLFPARRKLPRGFEAGVLSGSAGAPIGPVAAAVPGGAACAACGAAIDPRSAYLDDDGRSMCHTCFEGGRVADLEAAAMREVISDGSVVGAIRVGALGIAGAELAGGVAEDLQQTRGWKDDGDEEEGGS